MPSEILAVVDGATFANPPWSSANGGRLVRADPAMLAQWTDSRQHALPARLLLQVGAIREEVLLRIYHNAASNGCHLTLLARTDESDISRVLRLLAIAPAQCVIEYRAPGAEHEVQVPADTRVPARVLVVRALATRLSRLPLSAMAASTVVLLGVTPPAMATQRYPGCGQRSLSRRLAEVGLASPSRLHRASRLASAWDSLRFHRDVTRSRLAYTCGFSSERTLCAAALELLSMSLRDATFALDDAMVVERLVAHCMRA